MFHQLKQKAQWLVPDTLPIPVIWRHAVAEIRRQFRVWIGVPLTVTGSQFDAGKRHVNSRTGWVAYVTENGFGFRWAVQGAWGQDDPVYLTTFITWADLWMREHVTQLDGSMPLETRQVDLAEWVSRWIGDTRQAMPSYAATGPRPKQKQEEDTSDDRLSTRALGRGSRDLDQPARPAEEPGFALARALSVS